MDVELVRDLRREIAVVEIEDLLADGGGTMRGLADKVAAVRREAPPGWTVSGLLVLRATHRNRQTVREFADVFAARFGGSSAGWLAALRHSDHSMPAADGMVWSSADGARLMAVRSR